MLILAPLYGIPQNRRLRRKFRYVGKGSSEAGIPEVDVPDGRRRTTNDRRWYVCANLF